MSLYYSTQKVFKQPIKSLQVYFYFVNYELPVSISYRQLNSVYYYCYWPTELFL
jgi:hypothetical protein